VLFKSFNDGSTLNALNGGTRRDLKWRGSIYERNGESVDYLLLHCDVASSIWSAFFSCFGLSWVMHRSVVDLLNWVGLGVLPCGKW
jgi:hypothetical protein